MHARMLTPDTSLDTSRPAGGSVTLAASAQRAAAGCESDGGVSFSWSGSCDNGFSDPSLASVPQLVLGATLLPGGALCTVKVRGCLVSSPSTCSEASISVTSADAPLIATIAGGDRSMPTDVALVLNATASGDADEPDANLDAVWFCDELRGGAVCPSMFATTVSSPGELVLELQEKALVEGEYTFTVSVRKAQRPRETASASVRIVVVAALAVFPSVYFYAGCPVPGAKLNPTAPRLRFDAVTTLEGRYVSASRRDELALRWSAYELDAPGGDPISEVDLGGDVTSTGLNNKVVLDSNLVYSALVARPAASGRFTAGGAYRFVINASLSDAWSFAACDAVFNSPPRNCELDVTTPDGQPGVALVTKHTVRSLLCADEDEPITYLFAFQTATSGPWGLNGSPQPQHTLEDVVFPYEGDGQVTVIAFAFDGLNAVARIEKSITVTRVALDATLVTDLLSSQQAHARSMMPPSPHEHRVPADCTRAPWLAGRARARRLVGGAAHLCSAHGHPQRAGLGGRARRERRRSRARRDGRGGQCGAR